MIQAPIWQFTKTARFVDKNVLNKRIKMDFLNANPARPFSLHTRAITWKMRGGYVKCHIFG
jgi:hypothetical protein